MSVNCGCDGRPMDVTHATVQSYRQGCRCWPCYEAYRAYMNAFNRKGKAYTTPAAETREHLLLLRSHGIGMKSASQLAGVSESTVRDILSGHHQRVRKSTAEALLAVTTDDRTSGQLVPKSEVVALVGRLREAGVSTSEMAAMMCYKNERLHVMTKRQRKVTIRTLRRFEVMARLLVRDGRVPHTVLAGEPA